MRNIMRDKPSSRVVPAKAGIQPKLSNKTDAITPSKNISYTLYVLAQHTGIPGYQLSPVRRANLVSLYMLNIVIHVKHVGNG
jgi:hypothetical protein